jgi:hypothetical protein
VDCRTFRTRLWLRLAMLCAAAFWAAVLAALARFPAAPAASVLSAAGFLVFFVCYSAVYDRTAVLVGPDGLVFRSVLRRTPVRWDEIVRVEVHTGAAGTLYAVLTRRGLVRFTSLIARHRELFQLLLDRGALSRLR